MSSPSSTRNDNRPMGAPTPDPGGDSTDGDGEIGHPVLDGLASALRNNRLAGPLQFVGFWAAIALPFLYVPLLVETQLRTTAEVLTFLGLVGLNVLALIAGHSYKRD